jgi:hypothetical protein
MNQLHRDGTQEDGFTAVEAIVAFAVTALAIVGLYRAIEHSYQLAAAGRLHEQVAGFAQSELEAIGADGRLAAHERKGTFINGVPWQLSVRPIKGSPVSTAGSVSAYTVVIEAYGAEGLPIVTLRTIRLGAALP